ncbi:MAG: hypothetical protein R6T85_12020 [Egibacteraceae bacterium]
MAGSRILGLLLIVLGAALLLVLTTGVGGEILIGLLGVGFLAAYAVTRTYGLLVPGGILAGLGAGIILESRGGPDEVVVLGLGLGFIAIAVVSVLVDATWPGWWWPLIPGGVLAVVGASGLTGLEDLPAYLLPAALIVLGLALLLRRNGSGSHGEEPSAEEPSAED